MPGRNVWLVLPSANLALCRANLPAWRERGYHVAVLQDRIRGDVPADLVLHVETYEGWAASVNTLAREAIRNGAEIVVAAGDDMLPDPVMSAQAIADDFLRRFPDEFGVMQPQGDSFNHSAHYCGSPWLGRAWCERMYHGSGPLWPGYRHNWADNELFWLAHAMGVLWERPDLTQRHEHFARHDQSAPLYWSASAAAFDRADAELFVKRAWAGFPDHEPLGDGPRYSPAIFEREYRLLAEVHLATRHHVACAGIRAAHRVQHALQSCAARGLRRVALFGAGMHTQAAASALVDPPVEVLCLIDDNPALQSRTIAGRPVISVAQALAMNLDAVILSANTREEALAKAAAPLANAGVTIVRLYAESRVAA